MSTSPLSRSYQADCFTPKRGLRRSPSSSTRTRTQHCTENNDIENDPLHTLSGNETVTCTPSDSTSFQSYQADCFTPMCRSSFAAQHCTENNDIENDPLHTLSSSRTVTCTPLKSASFQSYQADCFTPKRGLRRSPTSVAQHCTEKTNTENDPLHTLSGNETVICTPLKSDSVTSFHVGGVLREVQDVCFTPKRSLQRSPPATSEQKSSTNACDRDVNMGPPPTNWEIPRTPIETQALLSTSVQFQQFQVQPCLNINMSTPRRIKTPTHPLSQFTRAESPRREVTAAITSTASPLVTATLSPGVSKLPGLRCTDNDLAYLEHLKQLTELRAKAGELNKAPNNVSKEKEVQEHESKNIHSDVDRLRGEVQSSVHGLVSEEKGDTEKEKLQLEVEQLKKLNQCTAAKLEKTEKERKGKIVEVNKTGAMEIETLELRQTTLESKLTTTQTKRQEISAEYQNAQDELKLLQVELEKMSVSERGGDSTEQFEQSLRSLVRRSMSNDTTFSRK